MAGGIVPAAQAGASVLRRGPAAHSLMPYLIDPVHLLAAARRCMRRASAPGPDGRSWAAYRRGMRERLADLAGRLRTGRWQPAPPRMVRITSFTGKVFDAVIPNVEDRIVHRAMRSAVQPILETRVLAGWVSGYRPGRNRITALRQADTHLAAGRRWVADVDVAGASQGVTTEQLVDWLAEHVHDGSFLTIFRRAVAGLPAPLIPGSGLWPVLFHLRLAQVDARLGGLSAVRFADNYTAFTADQASARAAYQHIADALAEVGLRPNPRKSRIRPPHQANTEDLFLIDG